MASFNKVILMGNLTRDPQLSYLPSNTPVVEFGLATNHRYRGADGEMKEDTCFVDCRAYGKPAETLNQYMSKGRSILVEGRLQFQQWTAQDGAKRSKHVVVVDRFQFVGGRRDDEGGARAASRVGAEAPEGQEWSRQDADPVAPADSDIPF